MSEEYWNSVSICEMDPSDLQFLGIQENDAVQVITEFGTVVLRAVESSNTSQAGIIFVPYGLFANFLIGSKTNGTGMPSFKGITAEVEPAKGLKPMTIHELLRKYYGE